MCFSLVTSRYTAQCRTALMRKSVLVQMHAVMTKLRPKTDIFSKMRKSVLVQMHAGDDQIASDTNVQLVLRGWNHFATRSSVGGIK